jgi:hypothetical protein
MKDTITEGTSLKKREWGETAICVPDNENVKQCLCTYPKLVPLLGEDDLVHLRVHARLPSCCNLIKE